MFQKGVESNKSLNGLDCACLYVYSPYFTLFMEGMFCHFNTRWAYTCLCCWEKWMASLVFIDLYAPVLTP